jgi:hypothetical protein
MATAQTQHARLVRTKTPLLEGRRDAEDDEATRAHSPDFNDRPGSGKHTTDRLNVF